MRAYRCVSSVKYAGWRGRHRARWALYPLLLYNQAATVTESSHGSRLWAAGSKLEITQKKNWFGFFQQHNNRQLPPGWCHHFLCTLSGSQSELRWRLDTPSHQFAQNRDWSQWMLQNLSFRLILSYNTGRNDWLCLQQNQPKHSNSLSRDHRWGALISWKVLL